MRLSLIRSSQSLAYVLLFQQGSLCLSRHRSNEEEELEITLIHIDIGKTRNWTWVLEKANPAGRVIVVCVTEWRITGEMDPWTCLWRAMLFMLFDVRRLPTVVLNRTNGEEEVSRSTYSPVSDSWLWWWDDCFVPQLPHLPHHDGQHPGTVSQNKPSFSWVALLIFYHSNRKAATLLRIL